MVQEYTLVSKDGVDSWKLSRDGITIKEKRVSRVLSGHLLCTWTTVFDNGIL
jgi:hypothetical protein